MIGCFACYFAGYQYQCESVRGISMVGLPRLNRKDDVSHPQLMNYSVKRDQHNFIKSDFLKVRRAR